MSRLAKKPIKIPENVKIEIKDSDVFVKGPKGELMRRFRDDLISIKESAGEITVKPITSDNQTKMLLGTYVSHIKNMIEGVLNGFEKKLILEGVGYKAEVRGKDLVLNLGFSHPVVYKIPDDVSVFSEKNKITVSGIDKERTGLAASKIRLFKKPEPYKGKGIRYENEVVRRKAGKKVGGTA